MSAHDTDSLDRVDMERLVHGSDEALDALMARHAGPLFGFLCRFVGDEASASDLAQEAFVRVYRHRREFREGTRFSTWLFTIAGNLARNHLRGRSRRPEVPLEADGASGELVLADSLVSWGDGPDQQLETDERLEAVRRAVSQLPEEL
ncbi:MAG: sigma-70 family RNA polymerase sigma factor, partial [Verrucomicrobiae bacterium]|nr:sigma-70 family RNA polymerase sigma factor [Verrucomicrobiae bacterium]